VRRVALGLVAVTSAGLLTGCGGDNWATRCTTDQTGDAGLALAATSFPMAATAAVLTTPPPERGILPSLSSIVAQLRTGSPDRRLASQFDYKLSWRYATKRPLLRPAG